MSSTYGESLRLSIFGQSHGAGIGMTLDGIPAGLPVDLEKLQAFLARRAPGQNDWSTPRKEADAPEFLAGILDGRTCGAPIAAVIYNKNTRSGDYSNLHDCPRPGHADFTAQVKYDGYQDVAGGGHFSGRLTAPLCIAGGLCKQWLEEMGIQIGAHIASIAGVQDVPFDPLCPDLASVHEEFPVIDETRGKQMCETIAEARSQGDSVGGIIECAITGLPIGVGDPMFGGMEGRIAQIVYGIPAIKGVEFGAGFGVAALRGSQNNDDYAVESGEVRTLTNNAGGILGGITNGMPLIFRAAVKPTPSIYKEQRSISISRMEEVPLQIKGRHDPCIVPRAVPVIEAAAAIAVFDAILSQPPKTRRTY
ncbi:MAG: chorismate synthase [Oscillospiraceae bacterium]|nr:chorismate synthase [Oscillospiraceae bacterium]